MVAANETLMTVETLRKRLAISRATVYAMVDSGEIEHIRIGAGPGKRGTIRFSEAMIQRFLDRKTFGSKAARMPPPALPKPKFKYRALD